ncbi:hypothetical protein [Dethiobacter alkaliphilus]|nr:hypothetical protein [Dethiobacter alkaliphilus]MCW3489779.1 hypothetical protein [Dethiobacter alkaliphilus]
MSELFSSFRKMWSDTEWAVWKFVLVVFVVYFVGYQAGKIFFHLTN